MCENVRIIFIFKQTRNKLQKLHLDYLQETIRLTEIFAPKNHYFATFAQILHVLHISPTSCDFFKI
jgi:hypothetical protein